jgi:uncharacterized OsmC-like protein
MRLIPADETRARLELDGDGFEIVPDGAALSPFHLLAGSLAACTASTLHGWAEAAGVSMAGLSIAVEWETAAKPPRRVTRIAMTLNWPGLPESRVAAAERVAHLCPIHHTLDRAADATLRIERRD